MSEEHTPPAANKPRHILALSGGKDSTALAIYMKGKVPEMEYVFCDTEKELTETYDYLDKLEVYLGKPIMRLKHEGMGFDDLLKIRNGFLPSPQVRWCTEYLKIKPYEKYVGDDLVTSYVGIRADEPHRKGYISTNCCQNLHLPRHSGSAVFLTRCTTLAISRKQPYIKR